MICSHQNQNIFNKFNQTTVYVCNDCGIVFWRDKNNGVEQEILYEQYYKSDTGGRFTFGIEYIIRLFRFFRALKIFLITPRAKSILDIGSGRGFMLYYLKKYYKYKIAQGIQVSRNALDFSRDKLGLDIFDNDLLCLELNPCSFDVITMWHVLEHVGEPERYLEKIFMLLKERGILVVEVPNFNSWTATFTGKYWLGWDFRYHRYCFSLNCLSRMLRKKFFSIKYVNTFSLEYSIFISTQSIVSWLTKTNHLIFDWVQTGKSFPQMPLHILLFVIIFPVSFLINILLFFSKKGEILLIVAEKTPQ